MVLYVSFTVGFWERDLSAPLVCNLATSLQHIAKMSQQYGEHCSYMLVNDSKVIFKHSR